MVVNLIGHVHFLVIGPFMSNSALYANPPIALLARAEHLFRVFPT